MTGRVREEKHRRTIQKTEKLNFLIPAAAILSLQHSEAQFIPGIENEICIWICCLDQDLAFLFFFFAPGTFNVLLFSSPRLDIWFPEQNLHVSNLSWQQVSPRLPPELCELLS